MFSKNNALSSDAKNIAASVSHDTTQEVLDPWVMLIVDDEDDIHKVTELALTGVQFEGRGLKFLNAYSGKEALEILRENHDVALIILDVVMETNHAGLDTARAIRNELNNTMVRIVLRTGQPGEAPEEKVFIEYDINDYKEKTDLDRKRLFTTVYSAVRAYRDLSKIEESRKYLERSRIGLEKVIRSSAQLFKTRSINDFASGLLEQITSILFIDSDSMIVHVQGVSAVGENPADWEIISTNGDLKDADNLRMQEVQSYLKKACDERKSLFIDNKFIGYFESSSQKITMIYIEGCDKLDDLGRQLLDIFSMNITIAFENISLEKEITGTQSELILRLGEVLETRSRETGNHVRRLSLLSEMLAREAGLSEDECIEILNASPMHDIGKVAIPDSILLKPGRFTDEEFEKMKYHAEAGYTMLKGSSRSLMKSAALIAWQHHERYDGTGYPQGLSGEEIHIYARIVAITDVFDALMHRRCYKEPWELEETLDIFRNGSGSQFDPKLVDIFLNALPKSLEIIKQYPDE